MKTNQSIIISGIRQYSILKASQLISQALVLSGLDVKTAEFTLEPVMMSEVVHIRMGEKVFSPLALDRTVSAIVCCEPLVAAKDIAQYLSAEGMIIYNTGSIIPLLKAEPKLLDALEGVTEKIIKINFYELAKSVGDFSLLPDLILGMLFGLGKLPLKEEYIQKAYDQLHSSEDAKKFIAAFFRGVQEISKVNA